MAKYPMNPDRFQMKDLKRRVAALEKSLNKLTTRYDRMILRQDRRDTQTREDLEELLVRSFEVVEKKLPHKDQTELN